jgi:hypothetical protein
VSVVTHEARAAEGRAGGGTPIGVVPGPSLDLLRRPDELVLLTTKSMRARRHPRAIAAMWAWQTAFALLAALPAAGLVRAAWGGDPDGDAPLWAPGGYALVDWLWHDAHGLRAVMGLGELVLVVGAILGLVPTTALMIEITYVARGRQRAGIVRAIAGGLRALPAMALLAILAGLVQILVLGLGIGLGIGVERWTHAGMGEARAGQLEALVVIVFVALASFIGVGQDLGRATIVRFEVRGVRALRLGMRTLRHAPLSLWWSWAWRAAAGLVLIFVAGIVATRLGGRGGLALLVLGLLHQCVVVARIALRASWLARALRAVDTTLRRAPP